MGGRSERREDVELIWFSHQVGPCFGGGSWIQKLEKRTNVDLSFPVWNELEIQAAVRIRGEGSIKSLGRRPCEKTPSPSADGTWPREAWGWGRPIIHKPGLSHLRHFTIAL